MTKPLLTCPLDLEILIWICCRGDKFPLPSKPYQECVDRLLNAGVIKPNLSPLKVDYVATDLGNAWLDLILATPLPVPNTRWMDPRTDIEPGWITGDIRP